MKPSESYCSEQRPGMTLSQLLVSITMIFIAACAASTLAAADDSARSYRFDITDETLSQALRIYGQVSHQEIVFTEDLVAGLKANPLKGEFTAAVALDRLLEGTGLIAERSPSGALMIRRPASSTDAGRSRPGLASNEPGSSSLSADEHSMHNDADAQLAQIQEITVFGRRLGNVPGATATKTGTSLLETPFAVSVVSRELLSLRAVSNIGEAIETVSGVTRTIGFSGNQRYRIRAFQAVSYLRDGFRQSISQPEIDLQGVESIETLKGPASALYGRFEPGGVINFVSKRPQLTPGADVSITGGSYDYGRAGVDVTGPLNEAGTLLGRINLAYENAGSFRDLIDNEQFFVAPVIEYRPDEATSLLARVEYFDRDTAFDRGLGNNPIFLGVPISRNYGEDFMRLRKEQWTGALELNRRVNDDWRFRLGAYYSHVVVPEEEFFNYGFPAVLGTTVNRNFSSFNEVQDDRTFQAEAYGQVRTGPLTHRLLLGVEHTDDTLELRDGRFIFGAPGIDLLDPVRTGRPPDDSYFLEGDSIVELNANALYLQDEIAWDRWRLLLGGRYEEAKTVTFVESFINPAVTRKDRPFSPRAGLTFLATPDLSFYASWGRSFHNEGSAGLLQNNVLPKPTNGEQFEIGTKFFLLDNRIEATLAAFDLTKTNVIVGDPNDFALVIQTGELVSRGIEAEISARPLDPWTLVASYGYADAKITQDTNAFIVGNRMAGVPRHQASMWTSWVFPDGVVQGLTLGGGIFYASEQAATTTNNYFLPSYVRIDLNGAYAFGSGYEMRINLDNVTDEKIYITGGFSQIYPQAPRSVRLTLTKRWR